MAIGPKKARSAALRLAGDHDDESTDVLLLRDIRTIFENLGEDRLSSQDLVAKLIALEDRPWREWRQGKPGHDGEASTPPDLTALRLCLERLIQPRRDQFIAGELPPMRKPSDLPGLAGAIVDAVARGEITTREAA